MGRKTLGFLRNSKKSNTFAAVILNTRLQNLSWSHFSRLLRIELFKAKTETRYSVVQTMVTTYGVAEGIHSGIVQQEVTMDDLFEE